MLLACFASTYLDNGNIPTALIFSSVATELIALAAFSAVINRYLPEADEVAQLSVAAQHIERWTSPRSDYPMNRKGYHLWRHVYMVITQKQPQEY